MDRVWRALRPWVFPVLLLVWLEFHVGRLTESSDALATPLQAARAWQAAHPGQSLQDMIEDSLLPYLSTADAPEVDLLIRTGGESRISNFLLWQAAYAELFFTDDLWPDFKPERLREALGWFAGRDRRFGSSAPL